MNSPLDDEKLYRWLWHCLKIFDGPKLDRDDCEIYIRAVGSEDTSAVCNAFASWLRTGKRFPFPADIRELLHKQAES